MAFLRWAVFIFLTVTLFLTQGCCTRVVPIDSLPPLSVAPQVPHDPLFEAMTGKWVATGTILRKDRVDDVDVEWILGGRYLKLHELSRNTDAQGHSIYEADVLMEYDQMKHEYACLWIDSTISGGLAPNGAGYGKADGDSIKLHFKSGDTDDFQTTFVFDRAANSWKWIMDNVADGKLKPFARMTLTRK